MTLKEPLSRSSCTAGGDSGIVESRAGHVLQGPTLDLFGGRASQVFGAINVDVIATQGVRASTTALPFRIGSVAEVIASGPRAPFLAEASRVLQPGGRILINATQGNTVGRLPSAETLHRLELRLIQHAEPLSPRFAGHMFRRTDGSVIPTPAVRTTILEKNR